MARPCLIVALLIAVLSSPTLAIHIGISDPSVLSVLSTYNSSALYSLFKNHTVTFKAINVPGGRSSADINTFVSSISSESFEAVIGSFDVLLASACAQLMLPFYSLSDKLLDPDATSAAYLRGSSVLLVNTMQEELVLAAANFTTNVAKRKTIVMLTDDVGSRLNILFQQGSTLEFRIYVVDIGNTSRTRQQLYNSTVLSSVDTTVYLIMSGTEGFAAGILKEAVFLSMLKANAYWIVADLFLDKNEILPYYATSGTIITFQLPNSAIASAAHLNFSLAIDAIQHYIASKENNSTGLTSIMQKIFSTSINGAVSRLQFNETDRRANKFAAILMAVSASSSTELIRLAVWNQSEANSLERTHLSSNERLPHLRLAGDLVDPYLMINSGGYTGFCISVLEKISANLFTFDTSTIILGPNYLQALERKEADIAVNLIEPKGHASNPNPNIVLSEIPLINSGLAAMGMSAITEVDFLSPLYPLTWNVWFAIVAAFILLSATLYLTDKISPNDYKRPKFSVAKAAFFVYSSFVMSKLKSSAVKPSSRIFILILWFASLMYCTTYGTNYFFLLVRTNPNLPFSSLSELWEKRASFDFLMVYNSSEHSLMTNQNSSTVYNQIVASRPMSVASAKAAKGYILNNTFAGQKKPIFIGDEQGINYLAARECKLKAAGKNELTRYYHLAFSTNISKPLLTSINNRIQELSDKGELEQIKNSYWTVILCSASENLITYQDLTNVRIDQVAGIFIVLAGAFILSFLVVAMEYIAYIIGLQIQRARANPNLEFNSSYRAVVTGITPAGVYVKLHGEKEFIPNQMLSPDASKGMTASDLQISYGSVIELTYLGNDPVDGYRIFHRRG